ncbi:MAG TPA: FecR domain-containing protein [Steroidobacteraceae bacterium]|jgi:ferric-dicitrate binding protein FerR (iron transport regulator)
MNPGWAAGPIAWIVHRAALSAPDTICHRLEEEWLADLSQLDGVVLQLRFAFGCCRAAIAIRCERFTATLSKPDRNIVNDLPSAKPRIGIRFPFGKRRERTREDAYTWLERLRRGLREEEGPKLQAWLKPRSHRACIVRAAAQRIAPEDLAVLHELFPVEPAWVVPRPGRSPTVNAVAALMALGVTYLSLLYTHHSMPGLLLSPELEGSFMEAQGTVYSSGQRTLRSVNLPDGTRVVMNRGTRIAALYAEGSHSAMLVRGEATFTVPPQAPKSFYLTVGDRLFSTKASTFSVRITGRNAIELTVLDGTVQDDGRHSVPTLLKARQLLNTGPGIESVRPLTEGEAQARIAWQRG